MEIAWTCLEGGCVESIRQGALHDQVTLGHGERPEQRVRL